MSSRVASKNQSASSTPVNKSKSHKHSQDHEWASVALVLHQLELTRPEEDDCGDLRKGEDSDGMRSFQISEIPGGMCYDRGRGARLRQTERTLLQRMADVSTDKLVGGLFDDDKKLRGYLSGFVDCVNQEVAEYVDTHDLHESVFLIYKGGNVLADYFGQFLHINGQEYDKAHDQLMKRSDADFQFYFKTPQVFNAHSDHMKRLVVVALYRFAEWLSENKILPTASFINASSFTALATEHNKTHYVNGRLKVKQAAPSERSDFLIVSATGELVTKVVRNQRGPPTRRCDMIIVPIQPIVSMIPKTWRRPQGVYITFNDTLRFGEGTSRASFDLARMKLNIKVTTISGCEYHAPAELIDVSFSNIDDHKYQNQIAADAPMDTWTQVKQLDNGTTVLIPTLEYLVNHDLQSILFFETGGYPWNDPKYSKRMYRYIMGSAMVCTNDTELKDQVSNASRWSVHGSPIIRVMNNLLLILNTAALATENSAFAKPATHITHDPEVLAELLSNHHGERYTRVQRSTFTRATHQFALVLESIYNVRTMVIDDADRMSLADNRVTCFNTMMDDLERIIKIVEGQLTRIMTTGRVMRGQSRSQSQSQSQSQSHEADKSENISQGKSRSVSRSLSRSVSRSINLNKSSTSSKPKQASDLAFSFSTPRSQGQHLVERSSPVSARASQKLA